MADPKERAEHLMLLDLGRNDVGRVADIGKVSVTDSFFIERYSHVMHLVSNVEGTIRPGLDAIDALAAGLPAGTLSGAPKIRAMQIIDEFEKEKRGAVYAGAVGYFAADGSMDTCIVLRTALVKDGTMYVQAGGGVVADSVPEAEYQESVNKAKALMAAAEEAVRFASTARSAGSSAGNAPAHAALMVGILLDIHAMLGLPGIVIGLHPEPDSGPIAKQLAQPRRHRRRHRFARVQDIVELLARDAEQLCDLNLGPIKGRKNVFAQEFARMGRTPLSIALGCIVGHIPTFLSDTVPDRRGGRCRLRIRR